MELTDHEIDQARTHFGFLWPYADIDLQVKSSFGLNGGQQWLTCARQARLIPIETLAEQLCVSRQSIHRLEAREKLGTVSLRMMHQMSEAMDCDFVYLIRPKRRQTFADLVWPFLLAAIPKDLSLTFPPRKMLPKRLAIMARRKLFLPRFRKAMGWTNINGSDMRHPY